MSSVKKLLILDLDETLIHSREAGRGDFEAGPFRVTKRPFLDHFLSEVSQWYNLAVWTLGSQDYAAEIVKNTIPYPLTFVWDRQRCTRSYNHENDEVDYIKDLKKVKNLGYDLNHVLFLEDSPSKLRKSYGNLVRIMPFYGDPSDVELQKAAKYLKTLKDVPNVRNIEKRGWNRSFD